MRNIALLFLVCLIGSCVEEGARLRFRETASLRSSCDDVCESVGGRLVLIRVNTGGHGSDCECAIGAE